MCLETPSPEIAGSFCRPRVLTAGLSVSSADSRCLLLCVAVPSEYLPGRHAVLGSHPRQLVSHLQRALACRKSSIQVVGGLGCLRSCPVCGRLGRSRGFFRSPPSIARCVKLVLRPTQPQFARQVSSILIAIRSLLTDPNCASPANPEAAHLYQTDRKQYSRKVRRIAEKSVS